MLQRVGSVGQEEYKEITLHVYHGKCSGLLHGECCKVHLFLLIAFAP